MSNAISDIARKTLALLVLLIAGWVLLHFVIGILATVAWIVVAVVAVMAVIWAIRAL